MDTSRYLSEPFSVAVDSDTLFTFDRYNWHGGCAQNSAKSDESAQSLLERSP